jgi:ZIP family zinc transporter
MIANAAQNSGFALALTLLAGLSTGIGSLLGLSTKRSSKTFLTLSLGFSAGAMIYVSLVEILPKARLALLPMLGNSLGYGATVFAVFTGIVLTAFFDHLLPAHDSTMMFKLNTREEKPQTIIGRKRLWRIGLFSALAIAIHNFPEGLATFLSALNNPKLGISIAVAIAIHNIPEGLAVSAPIFFATGSRCKAFWFSFLSGLAEPVGGLVGYFLFRSFPNQLAFGLVFAAVAGVMVYISFDELLPAAKEYGEHQHAVWSLIAGMAVMAISLVLFA